MCCEESWIPQSELHNSAVKSLSFLVIVKHLVHGLPQPATRQAHRRQAHSSHAKLPAQVDHPLK